MTRPEIIAYIGRLEAEKNKERDKIIAAETNIIRRVRKSDRQRDKSSGAVRPKSALAGRKRPKPALTKIVQQRRSLYEPAQPQERMQ